MQLDHLDSTNCRYTGPDILAKDSNDTGLWTYFETIVHGDFAGLVLPTGQILRIDLANGKARLGYKVESGEIDGFAKSSLAQLRRASTWRAEPETH